MGCNVNVDWRGWLERWDRQQTGYLLAREGRYRAMSDLLDTLLAEEILAIDLANGLGLMSQLVPIPCLKIRRW